MIAVTPSRRSLVVAALALALTACASPAHRFDLQAERLDLRRGVVDGAGFRHVVFRNAAARAPTPGATLHVYLGGDGTPWRGRRPAVDPTPRDPLALQLMAADPGPAVYLGRPCYHGLFADAGCHRRYWLDARYAVEVVESLRAAVRRVVAEGGYSAVRYFGHSGGGALAVLMAAARPWPDAVVTVAANLDPDAWADLHGYARLRGSLNPARRPPLPAAIVQWHYVGGQDTIVPPGLLAAALDGSTARLIVVDDFDHRCCWKALWPVILAELAARSTADGGSGAADDIAEGGDAETLDSLAPPPCGAKTP